MIPKNYLLLFLVPIGLILVVLWFAFLFLSQIPPTQPPLQTTEKAQNTPPPAIALSESTKKYIQALSIVSPVSLSFAAPVDPSTLVYTITPSLDTFTTVDSRNLSIAIKPKSFWKPNTQYTLRVIKVKTKTGRPLDPFTVSFQAIIGKDEESNSSVESTNNTPR